MNFSLDDQFVAVAAASAVGLVVLVFVLRWRSRCRSCGAWGQTMSCERCGAVNDPFAPTQPDLSTPGSNASSLATAFTRRDELRSTTTQQDSMTQERPPTLLRPPRTPRHGKSGEPPSAAEAREAFLQQIQPLLGLVGKVHVFGIGIAVFVVLSAIPRLPSGVAFIVAIVVAVALKKQHKTARKCPSCGAYGDPKAISCGSCGKQKRFT